MMYEVAIGIGTIFILILIWTVLSYATSSVKDVFNALTPPSFMNVSVNKTLAEQNYNLSYNTVYFSLFFISLMIIFYIIKVAVQQQKKEWFT